MGTDETKVIVCTWTEKENGKGDVYIPNCLGKSSNGVNIFKVAKKYNLSLVDIFRRCPFCGKNVIINALKVTESK